MLPLLVPTSAFAILSVKKDTESAIDCGWTIEIAPQGCASLFLFGTGLSELSFLSGPRTNLESSFDHFF